MLKIPLHRRPREEKKIKGHFQAHFPSSIMREVKDLHVVHCAILSSDSITHQTLPGMRKDQHILQNADSSKTTPKIASLFKTRVTHAVQSAFLDSLRYLNPSVLNRNLYL